METNTQKEIKFIKGEILPLNKRHITLDTAKKYNYEVGAYFGRPCHIANYYNDSKELVAQKLRYPSKEFQWLGNPKEAGLFGQETCKGKGKYITVTEGEIDALTMSQIQDNNRWDVVSIKTGAAGAKKDIQKSLDFLEGYENVIFMFDQDEHGQKAALECSKILTPNKAKIASLPLKDANEMLLADKAEQLKQCMWNAKPYRPDGIVLGSEIFDEIMKEDVMVTAQYPFKCLNIKTHGLRKGELTTITAGTGVGKSSFCRHVALDLLKQGFGVGYIALEESIKRSALGIMGVHLKKPLHLTREGINEKQLQETFKSTIGNGNFYLFNHFGCTVADNLLSKIRYLAKSCEVDFVVLDHLHMALSALGDEHTGDERKLIDYFVSKLRTLVEETGIGVILVSHLRRSEGDKGFEDGKEVTMNSLRGSASIGQLSDLIISISRDIKSDKKLAKLTILKNRYSGETGNACSLLYDLETGCLSETTPDVLDDY
ncbi:DNA primase [uncultured phage_MedDCM-OCT-S35-C6]|uniref:DNA helicase/primase n=1 Tax=uncultured phage_MedDCM-OCT-S35-C6 TaxID=2741075 RepID=A0A6S4PLU2_9CAUD|nr:DNA primase [uncultured phage_MedDCM-OCT-S35-C6]BAQ94194.1 DNA primase [uncultured phage_MedDCM-OCT-S35-C6]